MISEIADRLGGRAWETLAVLEVLVLATAFLAPRVGSWMYRRVWPSALKAGKALRDSSLGQRFVQRFPGVVKAFRKDYTFRKYLGLYFLVGITVAIVSVGLFHGIAELIHESDPVKRFDLALSESYRAQVSPEEVGFFQALTHLAGRAASFLIGFGVGFFLLARKRRGLLLLWVFGLVGNSILNASLKIFFHRDRPTLEDPFLIEQNYSFPSGHAMGSVVMYGLLAYVLSQLFPIIISRVCILVTLLLGVSVGMSRVVLGVHYASDVIAGWIIGLGWLSIVLTGAEVRGRYREYKSSINDDYPAPGEED